MSTIINLVVPRPVYGAVVKEPLLGYNLESHMDNSNARKKILFLITQSEMGGAQRYVYEIARSLDPKKYEILIAAGEGDRELNSKLDIKVQNLNHLKRVPNFLSFFPTIVEIYDLLKRERPDVLFLCSTTAGFFGSIAATLYKIQNTKYKIQVIYRIGGWAFKDPRNPILNLLILLAEKLTALLKDKIIVNNEEDLQLALKYGITQPKKLVKIHNGIDPTKLDFFSRKEARQALLTRFKVKDLGFKIVGTVANFYKTKGLEYLIEAAYILNTKYQIQNTKYIIIGDGRERPRLEAQIKKSGMMNQVHLVGRIPDAYRYLKAFDIFVLPSLKEGFPWIILEAMAAEVPIVATKVGALPEIIKDGKEGFLVRPKSGQALAEKVKEIIENPQLAHSFTISAKEKLKQFSLQEMLQQTESLL